MMICNRPREAWLLSTIGIENVPIVLSTSAILSVRAAITILSRRTVATLKSRVISHLVVWIVMIKGPCGLWSIFGADGFISKSCDHIWLVVDFKVLSAGHV